MCGHATIALGRFLVDCHDLSIFPNRTSLQKDGSIIKLRLHLPCGLIIVTVHTLPNGRTDPTKPVSFLSVPCYTTGLDIDIPIPPHRRWHVGQTVDRIKVDFAYAGGFFLVVDAEELLGRDQPTPFLRGADLKGLDEAATTIQALVNESSRLRKYCTPAGDPELGRIYVVIVTFRTQGGAAPGTIGHETAGSFFGNHAVDRSPTGSAVGAQMALKYSRGAVKVGDGWTFHSLVSVSNGGRGGFIGRIVEESPSGVRAKLEGSAYYTGYHSFLVEDDDPLGNDGFLMEDMKGE